MKNKKIIFSKEQKPHYSVVFAIFLILLLLTIIIKPVYAAETSQNAVSNTSTNSVQSATPTPVASPKKNHHKKHRDIKGEISAKKLKTTTELRTAIPAGFAELNAGETTLTDIYFGGQPIGSALIKYSDNTIQFLNPKGVLDKIPNVKNPDQILAILSKPIDSNTHRVCPDNQIAEHCGQITPPVIGVIYNPDNFRTDLFINSAYVAPQTLPSGLLGNSNADFSYLNSMSAVGSGTHYDNSDINNYNFVSDNILAYQNARLDAMLNYGNSLNNDNKDQLYFNQIYGAYYLGDKLFEAGILNTTGNSFINTETVLGLYAGTSMDTIQDTDLNDGTILQEFLPFPSTVNIYKDGRLMSTQHYNMGYQILNTSALPEGAYPVIIEIRTDQGTVTQKTRFFAKTSMIPPARYPQYYVNAGYLEYNQYVQVNDTVPEFSKKLLYGAGFNVRALSSLGVNGDVAGVSDHHFLTLGTYLVGNGYQIGPQVMVADHANARGLGLQAQGNIGSLQSNVYLRQVWGRDDSNALILNENEDQQFIQNLEDTNTQTSGTISYIVNNNTSIGINGSYTEYLNFPANYSYGPQFQTFLYQKNNVSLSLMVNANKTQDDEEIIGTLSAYISSPHWINTTSLGYRSVANGDANSLPVGPIGDISAYWRDMNLAQQGVQVGVLGHSDPENQNVGASLNASNNAASLQANVIQNIANADNNANTIYSATALTHIAYADNKWASGSGVSGDTGVIVYIASHHSGDKFDVYVNDQYMGTVSTNTVTPILLAPFQTYKVRIRDVSDQFYNYEQAPQLVTLYRGNMRTLTWHAKHKVIVYGYVQYPNGKSLAERIVMGGVEPGLTEMDGTLQAEIFDDTTTLQSELPNYQPCTIRLPKLTKDLKLVKIGTVICTPSPKTKT